MKIKGPKENETHGRTKKERGLGREGVEDDEENQM
jgi:hypothetical protein